MPKFDIFNILEFSGLDEDATDFELWKFMDENPVIRGYILLCLELVLYIKGSIDTSILSFVKKFPSSFNKKLIEVKTIKVDKNLKNFIINDFISTDLSKLKTEGVKYFAIFSDEEVVARISPAKSPSLIDEKTNKFIEEVKNKYKDNLIKGKFYPDYIKTGGGLYIKTKINIDTSDYEGVNKDKLGDSIVYRKLTTDIIFNLDNMNFWTVISKPNCPYCKKTKDTLKEFNIPFKEYTLTDSNKEQICKETYQYTVTSKNPKGYNKVPIIFRFDEFIGGNSDFEKFLKDRKVIPSPKEEVIPKDLEKNINKTMERLVKDAEEKTDTVSVEPILDTPNNYCKRAGIANIAGLVHSTTLKNLENMIKSGYIYTNKEFFETKGKNLTGGLSEMDDDIDWFDYEQYLGVYMGIIPSNKIGGKKVEIDSFSNVIMVFSKILLEKENYHLNETNQNGWINKNTYAPSELNMDLYYDFDSGLINEIVFHDKISLKFLESIYVKTDKDKEKMRLVLDSYGYNDVKIYVVSNIEHDYEPPYTIKNSFGEVIELGDNYIFDIKNIIHEDKYCDGLKDISLGKEKPNYCYPSPPDYIDDEEKDMDYYKKMAVNCGVDPNTVNSIDDVNEKLLPTLRDNYVNRVERQSTYYPSGRAGLITNSVSDGIIRKIPEEILDYKRRVSRKQE